MFHEFVYELVFYQKTVVTVFARILVEFFNSVGFDTRIVNKKRNRLVGVSAKFAGRGMVGKYGNGNGFVKIFHRIHHRTYYSFVKILDRFQFQSHIAVMTCLIARLNMEINEIFMLQCFNSCLAFPS